MSDKITESKELLDKIQKENKKTLNQEEWVAAFEVYREGEDYRDIGKELISKHLKELIGRENTLLYSDWDVIIKLYREKKANSETAGEIILNYFSKLHDESKHKQDVLLNAAKWKVVYCVYKDFNELSKKARDMIIKYALKLMAIKMRKPSFDTRLEKKYFSNAMRRLENSMLNNQDDVNLTYFQENIVYYPYEDAKRHPGVDIFDRGFSV